jgi:hypothetical protein
MGKKITSCTYYKYLGLNLSSRGAWSKATKTLSLQAGKAMFSLTKLRKNCYLPFDIACDLFDKMIVPILSYGSEIWGYTKYECVEGVHNKFLKQQMGLGSQTSNYAVYGDSGRFPLSVIYMCKCVKYWLKLLYMDECSYTKQCYNMLFKLSVYRKTWASEIKNVLFKYGFGEVWLAQSVGNDKVFLHVFKQRLLDIWKQEWHENVSNSSKLSTYYLFKSDFTFSPAKYLLTIKFRRHMIAMARFRCANHDLCIETGRRSQTSREERLCNFCLSSGSKYIEDEYHVLLICSKYNYFRHHFIQSIYLNNPEIQQFINIMKSENPCTISECSKFIFNLFKLRNS